jgi:hypothetical protein
LKPALENSLQNPILKIPNTKRSSGVVQSIGSEFKPCYCKKEKKEKKKKAYFGSQFGGFSP